LAIFSTSRATPTAFKVLRFNDIAEPDVDDRHKHTFYEIIWVDAGQSQQTIDYQSYPLGPSVFAWRR
jgi:AraC family transcriptional regulator, transcriptional activator of pobA